LITTLLNGKETLKLKEVTRTLLSHETRRKYVNNHINGPVARSNPKH
jgi:hypothetical protein